MPATFGGTIEASVAYAKPEAEVKIVNATINAASLVVDVDSVVSIAAEDSADGSDTDSQADAGIAVVIVDASALAHISGSSNLTITGAVTLNADNTINVASLVDGSAGGAGATLAVALLFADTQAYIDGSSVVSAGSSDAIELHASTNSSAFSKAISTSGGADQNTSGGNQTEANLQDPNNDSDTSDQASTSEGSINFAGAVAITYLNYDTQAFISSSGSVSAGDSIKLRAFTANRSRATADGSATGSGSAGVGIAVAINIADLSNFAYLAGNADLTAPTVEVESVVEGRKWSFDPASDVDDGSAETIDLGAPHGFLTGDAVVYDDAGGTAVGGLTDGTTYYVIPDASNPDLIKLASSAENAKNGTAINLTDGSGNEQSLTEKETAYIAEATSGAGGSSDVSIAGSLALNVATTDAEAYVASGANADVNGADTSFTASADTKSVASALPSEDGATGDTLGLGASVAINIVDNYVKAEIRPAGDLLNADELTLTATGKHTIQTNAKAGAKASGSTAITPVVAVSYIINDTFADFGVDTTALVTTGKVEAKAMQTTNATTIADAKVEGASEAAVGAALALNIVTPVALAETARPLSSGGSITFEANGKTKSKANAKASAKGGKTESDRQGSSNPNEPSNVDGEVSRERSQADSTASNNGGEDSSGSSSTPSAESSDGPVVVAAAIAVNITESSALS